MPCSAKALGADEGSTFLVAHTAVNGHLGEPCFGQRDERLHAAWTDLAVIAPPDQLSALALFAGFEDDGNEEQTVAFVNAIEGHHGFQMSVNLDAYADDPRAGQFTLAHEFAHVITQAATEIDRTDEGFESCATYRASDACFLPNSLIASWVKAFWTDDMLATLPSNDEPTVADGDALCAINASFLGPYAASNPEEDFAESFAAFVFGVPVDAPQLQAKLNWIAQRPVLAAFRERAVAAGQHTRPNEFEGCGGGTT